MIKKLLYFKNRIKSCIMLVVQRYIFVIKTLLRVSIKKNISINRSLDDESDNILLFKQWKDQENC